MVIDETDAGTVAAAPSQLIVLFSVLSAVFAAGYGVLFTMGGDYRVYGIGSTEFGLIISVGFIVSFFAQVIFGPLGDRGYARAMVLGGSFINAIGLLMMGFGQSTTVIVGGRVITGLAIGAAGPAIKRMVIVGSGPNLGRNLGRLFSADVFGFAMGPVISAVLVGPFGIAAPFVVIAAVTIVLTWFAMRSRIEEPAIDTAADHASSQSFAFDLLRHGPFAGAVLIGIAAYVMIGAFDAVWDQVHTDLETEEWMANLGIALFAIPLVILGPTAGKLAQRVGPFIIGTIGMSCAAIFFGIYGMLTVGSAIFAVTMVHAVTDGLTFAASGVAVGLTAPENRQAGAQGVLGGLQSLGAGTMALLSGWLYEHHGQRTTYWTAAAIILTLLVIGLFLARSELRLKG